MKHLTFIMIFVVGAFLSTSVRAQAPPPPGPPGGQFHTPSAGNSELPLLFPEARIDREIDLAGDNLKQVLADDPQLKGITRLRIVSFNVPRRPEDPPVPPRVMDYYRRILTERGWRPLWQSRGMGRPRTVYAGPEGRGLISILALPRGIVVTHIDGNTDIQHMPAVERAMQRLLNSRRGAPDSLREADDLRYRGQIDKAVEIYKSVIDRDPMASPPRVGLAMIQLQQGKLAEAEKNIRRAIELDPMNPSAHAVYARLLIARKNLKDAEFEAKQAVTIAPELPLARTVLGEVFEAQGKLGEAVAEYRAAVQAPVNRPEPYLRLGRLLERMDRKSEALRAYQDALKLDPKNKDARRAVEKLSQ